MIENSLRTGIGPVAGWPLSGEILIDADSEPDNDRQATVIRSLKIQI